MAIGDKLKGLFIQQEPKKAWVLDVPEGFEPEMDEFPVEPPPPSPRAERPRPESKVSFSGAKGKWTIDIEEMYAKSSEAEVLKNENNIYKVRQLVDTLPKDLGKSAIKSTLRGILDATRIPVANLERDAAIRQNVLGGYLRVSGSEMDARSQELNQDIAAAEQRIEAAKQELAELRAARSIIARSVEDEMNAIGELLSFLVLEQR